jgi:transcription elongation factor GreA-like protein
MKEQEHIMNPVYHLTAAQTSELRELWCQIRHSVTPERENFIRVKLGAPKAKISRKQLFMVMSQLTAYKPKASLPQWMYELDDRDLGAQPTERVL